MSFFEMQPKADADFVLEQIRRNLASRPAPPAEPDPAVEAVSPDPDPLAESDGHLAVAEANRRGGEPLPDTRLRTVKRLVARAIRPFTSRQEQFNVSMVAATRLLRDAAAKLARAADEARGDRAREAAETSRAIAELGEEIAALASRIAVVEHGQTEARRAVGSVREEFEGVRAAGA